MVQSPYCQRYGLLNQEPSIKNGSGLRLDTVLSSEEGRPWSTVMRLEVVMEGSGVDSCYCAVYMEGLEGSEMVGGACTVCMKQALPRSGLMDVARIRPSQSSDERRCELEGPLE